MFGKIFLRIHKSFGIRYPPMRTQALSDSYPPGWTPIRVLFPLLQTPFSNVVGLGTLFGALFQAKS
jgi:hypothetical protein